MPLRKSPTRTPALLAANRGNARKSTGPRTPAGKARARLNSLTHGRRSPLFTRFRSTLLKSPYHIRSVSQGMLKSEEARHPLFARYLREWGKAWARKQAYLLAGQRKQKRMERLRRMLTELGVSGLRAVLAASSGINGPARQRAANRRLGRLGIAVNSRNLARTKRKYTIGGTPLPL